MRRSAVRRRWRSCRRWSRCCDAPAFVSSRWPDFAEQQFSRLGLASVPYAVTRFAVDVVAPSRGDRNRTPALPSLVGLGVFALAASLVLVVRPATRHRLPLAALALLGPCWVVTVRFGVFNHEFYGMFYAGVPLVLFALTAPRLDRLLRRTGVRRRVTVLAGAAAAATFVLSCLLMARTVHRPERAERERTVMADFDVIRRLAEGKTVATLENNNMSKSRYFRGVVMAETHLADFFVSSRIDGIRSLTPYNRLWFLYDSSEYYAFLARYERHADRNAPSLAVPDYDVHLVRNEGGGDELLYFRRDCPASMNVRGWPPFFLHVRPVDVNDLPADRRRHGFENRDFDNSRFWRRDGKCYAVRSLPDYGIASIRTGQFTWRWMKEGVRRSDHVWAGSFSPGGHDGAVVGGPPR